MGYTFNALSGQFDITSSGSGGSVNSVSGTTPIASSGGSNPVISLNDTTVIPGVYNFANVTVDQKGRITAAEDSTSFIYALMGA